MPGSGGTSWTAVSALIVSAAAFGRTILAERRDNAKDVRTAKSSRFETDFGDPIRDELRSFEKQVRTSLRLFTLPVAKAVEDRLKDLPDSRQQWDAAAAAVEMLLREADSSPAVECDYWADTWQDNTANADSALQWLVEAENPTDQDLRTKAEEAYNWYIKAIADARSGLETERGMLAPLPPAGILKWIGETLTLSPR